MQGRRHDLRPGRISARLCIVASLALSLPVTLATLPGSSAWADSVRTSALTPGTQPIREADLPTPLSGDDADRYRRIFALQEKGRWTEANREIARLEDKRLIGAVKAQRYLHKGYHASYGELAAWLVHHADEPEAKEIYALALERHPIGAPLPPKPSLATLVPLPLADDAHMVARLTSAERRRAAELRKEIRRLAASEPRKAELTLAGYDARHLLDASEIDELRTVISDSYLAAGKVQQALALSAATHSPAYAAAAHWQAGLAAWRLGRYGEAGIHFQELARLNGQSSWTISAAAFWAARVELKSQHPELFNYWLGIAAEHPHTFYGILARHILGSDASPDFDSSPFTEIDAGMIESAPAGERALALLQVGEAARAEAELRGLAVHASPDLLEALLALADRANMPGLSLQLAGRVAEDGRAQDHALYPVPRWTPLGGFTVDRALLFAVMRQESQFLPTVESNAGALGLMQLMPATAHAMVKRTGMSLGPREEREALVEPELNLTLAQEYISSLLADEHINGNLVLFAAAYNCGPAAAQRWHASAKLRKDPLLFIESIPAQQTRIFTERVLANYWMYRQRLGQPAPDLDALAAGQWPTYTALDTPTEPESRHAENR